MVFRGFTTYNSLVEAEFLVLRSRLFDLSSAHAQKWVDGREFLTNLLNKPARIEELPLGKQEGRSDE